MVFGTSQRPFETVEYFPPLKQITIMFVQTILTDHHETVWMKNNP